MKAIRNRLKSCLLLTVCLLFLFSALPVHAELADAEKEALASNVEQFLGSVYGLSDLELEQLKENGGFYEVFYNAWTSDRDTVGAFKEVTNVEIDDSDPEEIVVTSDVTFEKYTADVLIYIDGETRTPKNYEMNIDYSLKEKVVQGAQNMAVGLIVVFAVLVFLTLIIFLFRLINPELRAEKAAKATSAKTPESGEGSAQPQKAAPAAETPAPAQSAPAAENGGMPEEIVAVIAAAIAAAEEDGMQSPQIIGIPAPVVYDHGDPSYQVRPLSRNSSRRWRRR